MKKFFTVSAVSMAALTLAACGNNGEAEPGNENENTGAPNEENTADEENNEAAGDQETITWQMGHLTDENHVWHQTAEHFAELVNENTDGLVEIEIYPNEQLGGETSVLDSISAGTADMTISGETMENWAPEAALMATPYAIQDEDHLQRVVEGEIGSDIEAAVEEQVGVTPLYYHMRAPRNLTSNEPISSVEDLEGFGMRIPNVPVFMNAWEAAGASPQVMDFSEVFTGLQQGVIDGQENPVDLIHSGGLYEVQEYVNETEHVYSWIYVVVGNDQFNELDEENQEAVREAAAEAQQFGQDLYEEETAEYVEMLEEEGMTFNSDVDQEAIAEAMQPGIEESLSEEQMELFERIVEEGEQ